MARAIHNLIKSHCPQSFQGLAIPPGCLDGDALFKELIKINYTTTTGRNIRFKPNGDAPDDVNFYQTIITPTGFTSQKVGKFENNVISVDQETLAWNRYSFLGTNKTTCTIPCLPNQVKIATDISCCWSCRTCRDNEVVNQNATDCAECPITTWPDQIDRRTCKQLTPKLLQPSDTLFLVVTSSSAAGQLAILSILLFVAIHRNKKLLKATSIPSSVSILICLYLLLLQCLVYLMKPSRLICTLKLYAFHITYSLLYGFLLTKSLKIFLIFRAAEKFTQPKGASGRAQIIGIAVITSIQVRASLLKVCLTRTRIIHRAQMYCTFRATKVIKRANSSLCVSHLDIDIGGV